MQDAAYEHPIRPLPLTTVELFRPLLPYELGFASGAMIWVFSELVPDAVEETSSNLVAVVVTVSVVAMVAFQILIR
jgi:zinc transporter, ZIP family